MNAVFIESNQKAYSPTQCGETMTVSKLMSVLEKLEAATPIYTRQLYGGDFAYGHLTMEHIDVNAVISERDLLESLNASRKQIGRMEEQIKALKAELAAEKANKINIFPIATDPLPTEPPYKTTCETEA